MNRTFLAGLMVAMVTGTTGCLNIKPVGPMAKVFGTPDTKTAIKGAISTPDPVMMPAPKPVAPAVLVTPGEVSELNPGDATKKLLEEIEQDRRSMEAMPKTSEISIIKGKR